MLVAGGGVAALEALLALHELVGRHVQLELLAPGTQFLNRPASVAAPFGLGGPGPVVVRGGRAALRRRAAPRHARRRRPRRRGRADRGRAAPPLRPRSWSPSVPAPRRGVPGALAVLRSSRTCRRSPACWTRPRGGAVRAIVFTMASGVAWTLPLYELAIMTAIELRDRGADDVAIRIVSPEAAPLQLFGGAASAATAPAAARARDRVRARPRGVVRRRRRQARGGRSRGRGRVRSRCRRSQGPWIEGLPGDDRRLHPGRRPRPCHRRARRLRRGRRDDVPDQAGRPRDPAGRCGGRSRGRGSRPARHRRAVPSRAARAPAHRRSAAVPARGARRARDRREPRRRRDGRARPPRERSGGRPARWPAAISRRTSPPHGPSRSAASRWSTGFPLPLPAPAGATRPTRSSSRSCWPTRTPAPGDYAQALHALDAAAALAGGVLPAAAAAKREAWLAALGSRELARP